MGDRVWVQFLVQDIHLGIVTSHRGQLNLAIPSWAGPMSTSRRAVTPCGWRVKVGMVHVWVTDKTA